MTAIEHIVTWIESSRSHYDELLALEKSRKSAETWNLWMRKRQPAVFAQTALSLVVRAYTEMLATGDASSDDIYSAADILNAAIALLAWELEA